MHFRKYPIIMSLILAAPMPLFLYLAFSSILCFLVKCTFMTLVLSLYHPHKFTSALLKMCICDLGTSWCKSGMGEIVNMHVIDLRNYCIGLWNCNINIKNYCITFLQFSPVENGSSKNIELIQFDTNYQRYLFEISQNCIVTYFSSWFVLDFCTLNDNKLIILYSKQYKTKYFLIKLVQNWGYIM